MQHLICPKCKTEYDLKMIDWQPHEPADIRCEVCHSALSRQDRAHHGILIMTKRGTLAA